jgi:hypothetical protein
MTKVLLASALCFGMFSVPMVAQAAPLTPAQIKECGRQPLSLDCAEQYAQRNQDNVGKILGDITAGRLPALPPPALPGLDLLPTVDLEKLLSK